MTTIELMKKASEIRKWLFNLTTLIPRNERPNPYYYRTESGLTLTEYYGCPGNLGTPIGGWQVDGGGCDNKREAWREEAKARLGLVMLQPMLRNHVGEHGPKWAITKDLDGNPLPEAKETNDSVVIIGPANVDYEKTSIEIDNMIAQIPDWKVSERKW